MSAVERMISVQELPRQSGDESQGGLSSGRKDKAAESSPVATLFSNVDLSCVPFLRAEAGCSRPRCIRR